VRGRAEDGISMNISNTVLIFEPGVVIEAKAGCFGSLQDPTSLAPLLSTRNSGPHACYPDFLSPHRGCAENLTIEGYGATLRMRKHDYMNASIYSHSEDRGGLMIYRAKNVTVRGLTVTLTGGDGLYIHECAGCHFSDLDLVDNYRQACSVISARDTTFDNCSFRDTGMTGGTAPQAGVDFEPNTAVDYLVNITLRRCTASNNVGGGFFLSYGAVFYFEFSLCLSRACLGKMSIVRPWIRNGSAFFGLRRFYDDAKKRIFTIRQARDKHTEEKLKKVHVCFCR
jgi:hypothetical protein